MSDEQYAAVDPGFRSEQAVVVCSRPRCLRSLLTAQHLYLVSSAPLVVTKFESILKSHFKCKYRFMFAPFCISKINHFQVFRYNFCQKLMIFPLSYTEFLCLVITSSVQASSYYNRWGGAFTLKCN